MGISRAMRWQNIEDKPTTVAGLGLSDFGAQAIAAQAGATAGGVGSYSLLYINQAIALGGTISAASLQFSSVLGSAAPTSGTWRCMSLTGSSDRTVFVRIA